MNKKPEDNPQPYVVVTNGGTQHSQFTTMKAAEDACKEANAQAEALEIKTRYTAQAR
jgi:hypothetical protein